MNNTAKSSDTQNNGAIRIRLHDAAETPRRAGASDEELFEEITIKLSRPSPHKEAPEREKPLKSSKDPSLSTPRILAQISLLALSILIGAQFGGLVCLAFILFVCFPIATIHWTSAEPRDQNPPR